MTDTDLNFEPERYPQQHRMYDRFLHSLAVDALLRLTHVLRMCLLCDTALYSACYHLAGLNREVEHRLSDC